MFGLTDSDGLAFTEALLNSSPSKISGTIKFTNGSTRSIEAKDIVVGGLSITKQAVTGDTFEVGAAVLGELDLKLITPKSESRAKYYNAVLTFNFSVQTASNYWQSVSMGEWIFTEVSRNKNVLEIIAYDNVIKLDKKFPELTNPLSGDVYTIMSKVASDCGITLAQSKSNFQGLTNGKTTLTIPKENPYNTYRQLVSDIAKMCGCFVDANAQGKIQLKKFTGTNVSELKSNEVYSYKLSDYEFSINEVEISYDSYTITSSSSNVTSGTTLFIDNAYAFKFSTGTVSTMANNILSTFESLAPYRPCEISMISDPRVSCGSRAKLYHDEGTSELVVTSYTWTFHDKLKITCAGTDPNLRHKTKSSNYNTYTVQVMEDNMTATSALILHSFSNESEVVSESDFTNIASVSFLANRDTFVEFTGTMQVNVEVDDIAEEVEITIPKQVITNTEGVGIEITEEMVVCKLPYTRDGKVDVQFRYKFNDDWIGQIYTHTMRRGKNIVTLHYPLISIQRFSVNSFGVYISSNTGNVSIDKEMFIGTISGQGIAEALKWDGAIVLEDYTESFTITPSNMTITDSEDHVTYEYVERNDSDFSELVDNEITQAMTMVNIDDTVQLSTEEGE